MDDARHGAMLGTCRLGSILGDVGKILVKRIKYHLPQYLAQGDTLFFQKNVHGDTTLIEVQKHSKLPQILELYHSTRLIGHFVL
jgi:hypothetical protein